MNAEDQPPDDAPPTDESLFERWAAGDGDAGERLFARHFDSILRFFRRQIGVDVDDLVQKTFLGCLEARARHSSLNNFRAFLFRIARNQLFKHLRKRSGQPVHIIGVTSVEALLPSPSRALGEQEEMAILVDALSQIPLEQQLALYFYYMEELSAPQVGSALGGLGVPAVRGRLRRALASLRKLFNNPLRVGENSPSRPGKTTANVFATIKRWEDSLPLLEADQAEPLEDELKLPEDLD